MSDAVFKANRVTVRHNEDGTTTCINCTALPFTVNLQNGSHVVVPAHTEFQGTADHQVFSPLEGAA